MALPTPEEQLLRFDMISRSAEALKRLKPHELRALWLRAQGHSYSEIGAITGWSYTKVNRCLSEGRRSFLEHYEGIESGEECRRWLPVLSAMVDGEASARAARWSCARTCATARAAARRSGAAGQHDAARRAAARCRCWSPSRGVGDHVVAARDARCTRASRRHARARGQLVHEGAGASFEASAAGKVAAVAASAAAVAGGGYASVERIVERAARGAGARGRASRDRAAPRPAWPAATASRHGRRQATRGDAAVLARARRPKRNEVTRRARRRTTATAPGVQRARAGARAAARTVYAARRRRRVPAAPAARPAARACRAGVLAAASSAPEFAPVERRQASNGLRISSPAMPATRRSRSTSDSGTMNHWRALVVAVLEDRAEQLAGDGDQSGSG